MLCAEHKRHALGLVSCTAMAAALSLSLSLSRSLSLYLSIYLSISIYLSLSLGRTQCGAEGAHKGEAAVGGLAERQQGGLDATQRRRGRARLRRALHRLCLVERERERGVWVCVRVCVSECMCVCVCAHVCMGSHAPSVSAHEHKLGHRPLALSLSV
jgi:hypothetical protein